MTVGVAVGTNAIFIFKKFTCFSISCLSFFLIQGTDPGKVEDFLSDQYLSRMCITAMDTADVDVSEPTGAELDLLQSKKKKKKGSKSNGLQIQGYISTHLVLLNLFMNMVVS